MTLKDYRSRVGRYALEIQIYDFTAKYIPGVENYVADIPSRPINFIVLDEAIEVNINDNLAHSNIDEYDDEPLLHYLKNNKHKPGSPKKQINRINRIKNDYIINHDRIYILTDKNKKTWKQIPQKNERNVIVEKAHLRGHVNAEAKRRSIRLK